MDILDGCFAISPTVNIQPDTTYTEIAGAQPTQPSTTTADLEASVITSSATFVPEDAQTPASEATQIFASEVFQTSASEATQISAPEATQILASEATQISAPEATQILATEDSKNTAPEATNKHATETSKTSSGLDPSQLSSPDTIETLTAPVSSRPLASDTVWIPVTSDSSQTLPSVEATFTAVAAADASAEGTIYDCSRVC